MIDILMATYNGGRYLEMQLLSIIGQTYPDWRLIIHDDGSQDNTISIIHRYMNQDERICLVEDDKIHLGAAANFMHLLKFVSNEIVMFSDQDDIWLEDKVEIMVKEFSHKNQAIPQVLYSKSYLYDSRLHKIYGEQPLVKINCLSNFLFCNAGALGCTLIVNKKVIEIAKQFEYDLISMHDHILCLIGAALGELSFIDMKLMLYRQHSNNVTGNQSGTYFDKIKYFLKGKSSVIDRKHFETVCLFYEKYKKCLTSQDKIYLEAYFEYPTVNLWKRLYIICQYNFKIFESIEILLLKTLCRKPIN